MDQAKSPDLVQRAQSNSHGTITIIEKIINGFDGIRLSFEMILWAVKRHNIFNTEGCLHSFKEDIDNEGGLFER